MKFGIAEFIWFIVLLLIVGFIILIFVKGKDLLKLRILQGSTFKQIAFLFSSEQYSQKNFALHDTGNASMALLPMKTGHEYSDTVKQTHSVLHPLKYQVYEKGKSRDETVLIISDRDYIPLDPNNRLTPQAKEKLASLDDIAKLTFLGDLADATKQKTVHELSELVIYGSFIVTGLSLIVYLIRGKVGG